MDWREACNHPSLRDLPFKIEMNEKGQILMSPVKVIHSLRPAKITHLLKLSAQAGEVLTECAVATRKGTKVADVAWVSSGRLGRIRHETECSIAPEICVEILSAGNLEGEMVEKRALYFEAGAEEVWICDEEGVMAVFTPDGPIGRSQGIAGFPDRIEV